MSVATQTIPAVTPISPYLSTPSAAQFCNIGANTPDPRPYDSLIERLEDAKAVALLVSSDHDCSGQHRTAAALIASLLHKGRKDADMLWNQVSRDSNDDAKLAAVRENEFAKIIDRIHQCIDTAPGVEGILNEDVMRMARELERRIAP